MTMPVSYRGVRTLSKVKSHNNYFICWKLETERSPSSLFYALLFTGKNRKRQGRNSACVYY